ncbi:unnamed protein product [Closterium sp. NIES-64]|nr:unnamed protein product [Closterium sp. NIES-64]
MEGKETHSPGSALRRSTTHDDGIDPFDAILDADDGSDDASPSLTKSRPSNLFRPIQQLWRRPIVRFAVAQIFIVWAVAASVLYIQDVAMSHEGSLQHSDISGLGAGSGLGAAGQATLLEQLKKRFHERCPMRPPVCRPRIDLKAVAHSAKHFYAQDKPADGEGRGLGETAGGSADGKNGTSGGGGGAGGAGDELPLVVFFAGIEGSGHKFFEQVFRNIKKVNFSGELLMPGRAVPCLSVLSPAWRCSPLVAFEPLLHLASPTYFIPPPPNSPTSPTSPVWPCPRLPYARPLRAYAKEMAVRLAEIGSSAYLRARDSYPLGRVRTPLARPDLVHMLQLDGLLFNLKVVVISRGLPDAVRSAYRMGYHGGDLGLQVRIVEDEMVFLDTTMRMIPCSKYIVLDFDWVADSPELVAEPLADFLGMGLTAEDVIAGVKGATQTKPKHQTEYPEFGGQALDEFFSVRADMWPLLLACRSTPFFRPLHPRDWPITHSELAGVMERRQVHRYKGERFFPASDAFLFRGGREGLFMSTPYAIANWQTVAKGVSNGKAYIRFDHLEFHRPAEEAQRSPQVGKTGRIEALLFDVEDRDRIGYATSAKTRSFCCTPELVQRTGCNPGHVIVRPRDGDHQWPRVVEINFFGNDTTVVAAPSEIRIKMTGMYYLWFVICDKSMAGVSVTGTTVWKNPDGYLPGMMAPYLLFYEIMAVVYTILGIVWFAQYFRFWQDGLQIHTCITAVLVLSMAEMATWFYDFANFNSSGFRPIGTTIWAATLGAIRKAVSRVLVLVVSMGFGVVRPTLGGLSGKVVALGVGYFAAVELLDVMQNVGAIDDLTSSERLFLVLPVAVLDAIFILWIFSALSKTLAQLQAKRTTHKLELYRKFTNSLAIAVLVSVAWIGFEMYLRTSDPYNEQWEGDWITGCFWHVLTLMLLCLICVLWAPSRNATRYAYSEDVPEELGEEEVALTTVSTSGGAGGGGGGAEKKQAVNTDVFSLDDELEEGKKE